MDSRAPSKKQNEKLQSCNPLTDTARKGYRRVYVTDNAIHSTRSLVLSTLRTIVTDSHFLVPCAVLLAGIALLIVLH